MQTKVSILTGVGVSVLLAAALLAALFFGTQVAGTAFPAYDVFDLLVRRLPGSLLTAGIDLMVDTIRVLNLGPTDDTAKLVEQVMAVVLFGTLAVIVGTIYFAAARRLLAQSHMLYRDSLLSGLLVGVAFGLPMIAISAALNQITTVAPPLNTAWLLLLFAVWGLAHGWALYRLFAAPAIEESSAARTLDRRQFLIQLSGATATITVIGAGLGGLLGTGSNRVTTRVGASIGTARPLPNDSDPVQPAPGTRSEYTPLDEHYRIDINTGGPPRLNLDTYTLKITGLVETPLELTLDEIRSYEAMSQYITMSCISNRMAGDLISTTLWTGTSMQHILDRAKPLPDATHIKIKAADGFDEVVALDTIRQDERVLLTYDWDSEPLREKHGAPLRIHIPDLYGMKQPKWITEMEFIPAWQEGYWVRRGWDKEARVRATAVVDSVAADAIYEVDGQTLVPVGGIAWAGARGISRVEVSVDDGEWTAAQLRAPLSDKTWIVWRYDWPFAEGSHRFAVRCVETDGTPQIEAVEGVRPSGATGIHSVTQNL